MVFLLQCYTDFKLCIYTYLLGCGCITNRNKSDEYQLLLRTNTDNHSIPMVCNHKPVGIYIAEKKQKVWFHNFGF
jgi:hypothetical protein